MNDLYNRLTRLSFAYLVCPKKDKKIILKELNKLRKQLEAK